MALDRDRRRRLAVPAGAVVDRRQLAEDEGGDHGEDQRPGPTVQASSSFVLPRICGPSTSRAPAAAAVADDEDDERHLDEQEDRRR